MVDRLPVGAFNGEQAFWVDGAPGHHLGEGFPSGNWVWDKFYPDPAGAPFEGFQWRTDDSLKLNFFWLLFYMTQGDPGQMDSVLFDDIVVATEYIGPIASVPATPRLRATKQGGDVLLVWTDTGASSYRLVRADNPELSGPTLIFEGAGLEASDPDAVPTAADYYYNLE